MICQCKPGFVGNGLFCVPNVELRANAINFITAKECESECISNSFCERGTDGNYRIGYHLTEFSIFVTNLIFFTEISIFARNLNFWQKSPFFKRTPIFPRCFMKFQVLLEIPNFLTNVISLQKSIFDRNLNFWQKYHFWQKPQFLTEMSWH